MPRLASKFNNLLMSRGAYSIAMAFPLAFGFAGPDTNKQLQLEGNLESLEIKFIQNYLGKVKNKEFFYASNDINYKDSSPEAISKQPTFLISEILIEGLDGHPEKERLEFAAYDAMTTRPGSNVTRNQLKLDLDAIYSTGWFSGVKLEPVDGLFGLQLLVKVEPNPVLKKIKIEPQETRLPQSELRKIFAFDFGKTLNLNTLQLRMKNIKKWYSDNGYSLARISGPNRVTSDGLVQLKISEGVVSGIELKFLNKEGESSSEEGVLINGKTKPWVIKREISIKPGDTFNRKQLEADIKRIYETSLFSDVKVTLKPVSDQPGNVIIVLGITEQSTGSLSGGIGYSQSQGVFGQIGLSDTNLFGRAWNSTLNITYGQYGGLANLTFSDPWIKGDLHRTSFRTSFFISREVPQIFRSQDAETIRSVEDYFDGNTNEVFDINSALHSKGKFNSIAEAKSASPGSSWFDYDGNSVALQRTGASFIFSRPLNGGNPYKDVPWSVLLGMNIQTVKPIDYSGESRPYGVATRNYKNGSTSKDDIICVAFNCAEENNLFGVRAAATYNTLNNPRNPTSGNFLSLGTEQFVSIGENSPTFNRAKVGYTHFIPVNWLKIAKGCRSGAGDKKNCPQAIGFQVKAGTIVGQLPPYEAFCLGGASSVRGWGACNLAVGRSFAEASVEYRFPIWNIVSGALFVDGGTDLGSQSNVPGKPGKLLQKQGSGFSLGSGLIINTPVGPLRLEAASQDFNSEWRFNLGVGWKF